MDMNKTTAAKPSAPTFEKMTAGTTEAAELIRNGCSTALKGAQDYSNKFLEFTQANTNAAFDFAQKVSRMNSPSEFMELSAEHARAQTQTLTDQTQQLAELAQKVALVGAKPLQEGVAKAFNHAA